MKVVENDKSVAVHRKKTGAGVYRFGFNGKENDNEVKGGDGLQQDYGMRVFDPRLGKFLSVDPLTKDFPWNSPYAFAENDVIRCLDLDGAERLPYVDKYQYNGSWTDYVKWIPNIAGNIYNGLIADTWNSGVNTVESLSKGTYLKDLGGEIKQIGSSIKQTAINTYDYTVNTPIRQQFVDAGNDIINPQNWERIGTLYVGSKLPLPQGNKGNLLASTKSVKTGTTVAAEKMAEKVVAQGIGGTKFTNSQLTKMLTASEDDMMTVYRGMTGSEGGSGALFLAETAEYASTYSSKVSVFKISRSGFNRLKMEGLIEELQGISLSGTTGKEFKIANQEIKQIILDNQK